MRKLFPCGHRGKGRYCHRCEQDAAEQRDDAERLRLAGLRALRAGELRAQQAAAKARAEQEDRRRREEEAAKLAAEAVRRSAEAAENRRRRQELASLDVIELEHLPPVVRARAREMLQLVAEGASLVEVGGKRLVDRTLISVPLGLRWRLVLREMDGRFVPLEAMSHEKYNHICTRVLR